MLRLGILLGCVAAAGVVTTLSTQPAELGGAGAGACRAAPVRDGAVRAGPFKGLIAEDYDVVDGRFGLRVGRYRDREAGLSQKIPWFVATRHQVGFRLTVLGRRLDDAGRFRQKFRRAGGGEDGDPWVYPSILAPPQEGCWRLRFRSRDVRGRLTVLVRGHGR